MQKEQECKCTICGFTWEPGKSDGGHSCSIFLKVELDRLKRENDILKNGINKINDIAARDVERIRKVLGE